MDDMRLIANIMSTIKEKIMEAKYLQMLGRAVRNICADEKETLTNEEVGTIIFQYVQALDKESMRDARDKINGKGQ